MIKKKKRSNYQITGILLVITIFAFTFALMAPAPPVNANPDPSSYNEANRFAFPMNSYYSDSYNASYGWEKYMNSVLLIYSDQGLQ